MFNVRQAASTGYISNQRVFLTNPVEEPQGRTPKKGEELDPPTTYEWDDLISQADYAVKFLNSLENQKPGHRMPDERLYIRRFRLVELPSEYFDNGQFDKRSFFNDHAEFGEATFGTSKFIKTRDPDVKQTLGGGLPGNTLLPMELVWARRLFSKQPMTGQRYGYWRRPNVRQRLKSSRRCEECGQIWDKHLPQVIDRKQFKNWTPTTLQNYHPGLAKGLFGIVKYTGTEEEKNVFSAVKAEWL